MPGKIANVALLGADGKFGPSVLQALSRDFKVTVLKRESSDSPSDYPAETSVKRVPDSFPVDTLTDILRGVDAVVVTINGSEVDLQRRLAEACVQASVKRFIPADFGSCDSSSPLTQELVPLYKRKTELREFLTHLAHQHESFSWTCIVCGHFFDWNLEFIHIWLRERRADVLDEGRKPFSISTLQRIAEAVARVLLRPEETKNRMLYVQSFCVSQTEIVRSFEKATGVQWQVTRYDAEEFKNAEKGKAGTGDPDAVVELVWYLGTVDADWRAKDGFAMELLGLENEDLDSVVERIVKGIE